MYPIKYIAKLKAKGTVFPQFRYSLQLQGSPDHFHFWTVGFKFRGSHSPLRFARITDRTQETLYLISVLL